MTLEQVMIALDQLGNALLGGMADETISAHAFRQGWTRRVRLIDWIFRDPNHCRESYNSEILRRQLPAAYRSGGNA